MSNSRPSLLPRHQGWQTPKTSIRPSSADYLAPSVGIEPGSVFEWPAIHWLRRDLVILRPRPSKSGDLAAVRATDAPTSPFSFYRDKVEAVMAHAKRRPCLVISNRDEVTHPLVRVVPYFNASSDIVVRNRAAIEEGRYPRFMVLPQAPWQTKDNLLDFMATCMIPRESLLSATQVGRLAMNLLASVRQQYALYALADTAEIAAP